IVSFAKSFNRLHLVSSAKQKKFLVHCIIVFSQKLILITNIFCLREVSYFSLTVSLPNMNFTPNLSLILKSERGLLQIMTHMVLKKLPKVLEFRPHLLQIGLNIFSGLSVIVNRKKYIVCLFQPFIKYTSWI
ncbi:hypothetical protein BpHYR1_030146, partial [Brachionus plicatilis]